MPSSRSTLGSTADAPIDHTPPIRSRHGARRRHGVDSLAVGKTGEAVGRGHRHEASPEVFDGAPLRAFFGPRTGKPRRGLLDEGLVLLRSVTIGQRLAPE